MNNNSHVYAYLRAKINLTKHITLSWKFIITFAIKHCPIHSVYLKRICGEADRQLASDRHSSSLELVALSLDFCLGIVTCSSFSVLTSLGQMREFWCSLIQKVELSPHILFIVRGNALSL
jgi:hypothetical protein